MSCDLCKPLSCDCLEPIFCRKTVEGKGEFHCHVPEWTLCVTRCEFLHFQKVECGTKSIFVPGEVLVQFVWFDGSHCRHGFCRIPANFTFPNPCKGEGEKVLVCNCGKPHGDCRAKLVIERDHHTGKRRHAQIVACAEVSLEVCCLVGVHCPEHEHEHEHEPKHPDLKHLDPKHKGR